MHKPLRVAHIVPAPFGTGGTIGGAERYALELARHMADVVPTRLVTFGETERHERIGSLDVHVIGNPYYIGSHRYNPLAPGPILRELLRADIMHCHQQHVVASSFTAAACRLTRRKVFVSDLGGGGWDVSAYVSTDRWYHGHLHISEYSRTVMGHANKPWARVILGGVDTESFSPDFNRTREPHVLFVGRIVPHKGIDYLIQAMPPNLSLEIIGYPYDSTYVKDLRLLAGARKVVFRSKCDDRALIEAYRSAMCVVLPSVYRTMYGLETRVPELLGQTLLEGMACGTPAICTNVASMPEVVEDGVTGFIVPPNDPSGLRQRLSWLADHPERARAMGRAGRERVLSLFTWPKVVQRCLEIYQSA